jgi:hypothetical protein
VAIAGRVTINVSALATTIAAAVPVAIANAFPLVIFIIELSLKIVKPTLWSRD